jgi:AraC-like DNA-binding protein
VASQAGILASQLWKIVDLPPNGGAAEGTTRVDCNAYFTLWEQVARKLQDPGLPIRVAQTFDPGDYDLLGFVGMTAPSLRAALHGLCSYYRLWADASAWTIEELGGTVNIVFHPKGRGGLGRRLATETSVAELLQAARKVTGTGLRPTRVGFAHPAPASLTEHRRFFGALPLFDQERDELVMPARLLEQVPRLADPGLAAYLEHQAETAIVGLPTNESWRDRVQAILLPTLSVETPTLEDLARRLATTPSTLKRRLRDERCSFRELLGLARRELAVRYLSSTSLTIAEIASALGFSEASAFQRAFKSWTGETPGAFRRSRTHP